MDATVLHYLAFGRPIGYLLIFIGILIEGEAVLFTAMFLTHQGFFNLEYMLFWVLLGVIIGDMLWYRLGAYFNILPLFIRKWVNGIAVSFDLDNHLRQRTARTIFISKFTYGFNRPILIRAGSLRVPLRKFFKGDLTAALLWIPIIGGLGYASSEFFLFIKHYWRFAEITILLIIVAFLFLVRYFSKMSKKKL